MSHRHQRCFPILPCSSRPVTVIRLYTRAGFPNEELQSIADNLLAQHQNSTRDQNYDEAAFVATRGLSLVFSSFSCVSVSCGVCPFGLFVVARCRFFRLSVFTVVPSSFLAQLAPSLALFLLPLMDSAQIRSLRHHLARAIMHLNFLAGLLPFFEPSMEKEEPLTPPHSRSDRPTPRGLHTFVPLPIATGNPSLASHGGIPSHMVINPEPHVRPMFILSPTGGAPVSISPPTCPPAPLPISAPTSSPGPTDEISYPRASTRTTIPVPVRSKQRASSLTDPQPKKKHRSDSLPESRAIPEPNPVHSPSLPILSERSSTIEDRLRERELNSDGSDVEVESGTTTGYHPVSPIVPVVTPTLTLTAANPKSLPSLSLRTDSTPGHLRPWNTADDQELTAMKHDTRSRPSWKTIGSRLHRDPQACKMRWAILKQSLEMIDHVESLDHPDRSHPPPEPEGED